MSDRVDHRIPDPSVSLLIPNNSTFVFKAPPSALGVSEDVQIDSVAVADRPFPVTAMSPTPVVRRLNRREAVPASEQVAAI